MTLLIGKAVDLCLTDLLFSSEKTPIFTFKLLSLAQLQRNTGKEDSDLKPIHNFFQVYGHNFESSQTSGFCMDFLSHREGAVVFKGTVA